MNSVHFPEFYYNVSEYFYPGSEWKPYRDGSFEDKHPEIPIHAAMVTCESKKYEPAKALAFCNYLQKKLVAGGKLFSPYKDKINEDLKSGKWDLDCPYDY